MSLQHFPLREGCAFNAVYVSSQKTFNTVDTFCLSIGLGSTEISVNLDIFAIFDINLTSSMPTLFIFVVNSSKLLMVSTSLNQAWFNTCKNRWRVDRSFFAIILLCCIPSWPMPFTHYCMF